MMDFLYQLVVFTCLAYVLYKLSTEIRLFLTHKPGTTEVKETKMRVSGDAQADIIEVLNKHKMTDQQVLSTLIYLAGISVATTRSERVFVEDHARRKKYIMTIEDV